MIADTPTLGSAIRHEWQLDPDFLTVNHGSFGATPRVVLAVQDDWRRRMEAQPSRFMRVVLPDALRAAADRLARFMSADGKDLAFLDNATTGCNAVIRSLQLKPGDEVLVLTHGYGAVRNTVRYVTELVGARMTEAAVPFPNPSADTVVAALSEAITPHTRLAVLDHITSPSALVLPLARMIAACHARGVPVLVDGAHGPGQVDINLSTLGADWYVGNCHKWLCAPKGSAFIWAAPDRQDGLHPVTISHGYGKGFLEEFDWTGTRDFSAFLATPAAIDFHHRIGGPALRARNIALAAEATAMIARRLNTEKGAAGDLAGSMGVVRLPLTGDVSAERARELRARLLEARTDVPLHAQAGGIWLRLSAHAYNEMTDYEKLAEIIARVLRS
ncbi:MAG TPA: aminotransferase class V-fold PLP-dependent enzyme [Acetobacteraceae bacterium]|nr:aminotransferase class V-fold PLP-dependent enzyme [Acetobacteraceae bacterium]